MRFLSLGQGEDGAENGLGAGIAAEWVRFAADGVLKAARLRDNALVGARVAERAGWAGWGRMG